jgi:hypothetical protein
LVPHGWFRNPEGGVFTRALDMAFPSVGMRPTDDDGVALNQFTAF